MAYQTRQQNHFSQHIITNNRQFMNTDHAAPRFNNPVQMVHFNNPVQMVPFNNPVQMVRTNPFATTMDNPWLGLNHMYLGSNNMVIQPESIPMNAAQTGVVNCLPNGARKRAREPMENQFNQLNVTQNPNINLPAVPQNNRADMAALMETDFMISQCSKRVKLAIAAKRNEDMKKMSELVRVRIAEKLKEKDEQILNMGQLNMALQERVKNLYEENQMWKDLANTHEANATSLRNNLNLLVAEVSKLQEHMAPTGAVEPLVDEEVESYCGSNISGTNKQGSAQGCMLAAMTDDGENAPEKVQNLAETGEISGGNKMCKICGTRESNVLVLPCRHLSFCNVCGFKRLTACPACDCTMTGTIHVCLT